MTETLTDALIVELSERVSTEKELRKLGVQVLKLPDYPVKTALTNNPRCIQSAAYDVLNLWSKQYRRRQDAYADLKTSLGMSRMDGLIDAFTQWVEFSETRPLLTSKSTSLSLISSISNMLI